MFNLIYDSSLKIDAHKIEEEALIREHFTTKRQRSLYCRLHSRRLEINLHLAAGHLTVMRLGGLAIVETILIETLAAI